MVTARGRSGFTLVEAAVALLILSLALTAGLEATGRALNAQRDAERHRLATAVAEWKMNHLASMTVDSLRSYLLPRREELRIGPDRYRWSAEARPLEGTRLWEVRTVVAWDDRSVTLESLLYRRPQLAGAGAVP